MTTVRTIPQLDPQTLWPYFPSFSSASERIHKLANWITPEVFRQNSDAFIHLMACIEKAQDSVELKPSRQLEPMAHNQD